MKHIIGRVAKIKGNFVAEQRDGSIRILNIGDPVYEGDSIYHSTKNDKSYSEKVSQDIFIGSDSKQYLRDSDIGNDNIQIELNNGETKTITDVGYLMLDSVLLGNDMPKLNTEISRIDTSRTYRSFGAEDGNGEDERELNNFSPYLNQNQQDDAKETESILNNISELPRETSNTNLIGEHLEGSLYSKSGLSYEVNTTTLVNDNPVASPDKIEVYENSPYHANVLENDTLGEDMRSDGNHVIGVEKGALEDTYGNIGTEIEGSYGKLTLNADGTYTYIPDNFNEAVNALGDGEQLTDIFSYTIADTDGDRSTAILTITINGQDDGMPTIIATDNSVYEKGLITGTENGGNAHTAMGVISFTAPDGFVEGSTINIGGRELSYSEITDLSSSNIDIDTAHGVLTLNDFDSETNEIKYIYTLTENVDHSGSEPITDIISIDVKDGSGSGQSHAISSLTITINDDAPTANEDINETPKNLNIIAGSDEKGLLTNDLQGADGAVITGVNNGSVHMEVTSGGTEIAGKYGKLILKSDGSYSYAPDMSIEAVNSLGSGEQLTEVFTYTITDGDGDKSESFLKIFVNGLDEGVPLITLSTTNKVYEGGLTGGNEPSLPTIISDKFHFTAPDNFVDGSSIKINDSVFTYSEILNLSGTNQSINTDYGVITLTNYNPEAKELSYSYSLTRTADKSKGEVSDNILIEIQDGNGIGQTLGPGKATLVINIEDDKPIAFNDTTAFGEDSSNNHGNLLTNDVFGIDKRADGNYATGVKSGLLASGMYAEGNIGQEIDGSYGKLTLNADGTYNYTPDNSNKAVNALGDGEQLTDIFSYTITDSDGDRSTATLTITINGQDDGIPTISAPDNSVHEKGLITGTENSGNSHIAMGVISFTAPDGFVNGSTINIGGRELSYSEIINLFSSNINIDTTHGVLTLIDFDSGTNEIKYIYTLTENVDNSGSEPITDIISIGVKDGSGSGQSHAVSSLTITINDDAPIAVSDVDNIKEGQNTFSESILSRSASEGVLSNDKPGADRISNGNYVVGVKSGAESENTYISGNVGSEINGVYGKLVLNSDGSYEYKLDNSIPEINKLNNGQNLTDIFSYTITDSDGDKSTATLTITINGTNDTPINNTVTTSGNKNAGTVGEPIEVILSANDVDSNISHFKISTMPDIKDGKLYTDKECNHEVLADIDYAVTSTNQLKLYFKPNYSNDQSSSNFGPNWTKPSITFGTVAKDGNTSDGVIYSDEASVTIYINDLPYANQAAEKNVTENNFGSTSNYVNGNVFTDGADYSSGKDYYGNDTDVEVYQIRYTDSSGNYSNFIQLVNGDNTFNTDYGTFTINRETGNYLFTPKSSLNNPSGSDLTFKFEYGISEKNTPADVSNMAEQVIKISDGTKPTIGNISLSTLDEANLPIGTSPDTSATVVTKSLEVTAGSDPLRISFNSVQTALDQLISNGLSSKGRALTYEVSNDGELLTAKADSETIFTISINNPTSNGTGNLTSATYTFNLFQALDHKSALLTGDKINLEFNFTLSDSDDPQNDKAESSFIIAIKDDVLPDKSIETNEDTLYTFNTNANATGSSLTITEAPLYGTVSVNADGSITYTPNTNYSGIDHFKYINVLDDGSETDSATVNVTVKPISDAPILENDKIVSGNEDCEIALNLVKPLPTDNIDQNSIVSGDNPERLGIIEIGGIPEDAVIKNGGTVIFTGTASQSVLKVYITDDVNLHPTGLNTTGAIGLTSAEFQALTITGAPNSHNNISLTLTATSYEVDDNGAVLSGVSGASSTENITVDIKAVTDPIALNWKNGDAPTVKPTITVDEDQWIKLDDYITPTLNDTDGSEKFKYVLDKSQLTGWKYKTANGSVKTISGTGDLEIEFNGVNSPQLQIQPPTNSSIDLNGLKIKLIAKDYDNDSTVTTVEESAELNFNLIIISPKAGDIVPSASGTGVAEDTHIKLDFSFNYKDTSEYVSGIKIKNIPDGVKLYEFDGSNYNELVLSGGSYEVSGKSRTEMLDILDRLYVLPKLDDNTDINLKYSIECTDTDENDTSVIDVAWTNDSNLKIKVQGTVDLSYDTDNGGADRLYTEINGVQTMPDTQPEPVLSVNEDEILDLKLGFESYEKIHNNTNDGSEKGSDTYFIIRNQTGDTSSFTICDSTGKMIGTRTADGGYKLSVEQLSQAHLKANPDWAGTMKLEMLSHVVDMGDDPVSERDWHEQVDKFTVEVVAVADEPFLQAREVFINEDESARIDIRPYTTDTDGSESLVSIKVADIPYGAVLKLKTGANTFEDIFVSNKTDGTASEFTFIINTATSTEFHKSASAGDTVGTLLNSDIDNIYITPPAHSSNTFVLKVTPTIEEELNHDQKYAELPLTVHVKGEADQPIIILTDNNASDDFGVVVGEDVVPNGSTVELDSNSDGSQAKTVTFYGLERVNSGSEKIPFGFTTESGETRVIQLAANPLFSSAKSPTDNSEVFSYVLTNLPSFVKLVNSSGVQVGTLIKMNGSTNLGEWALSADEINSGLFFEAPVGWSGKISGLNILTVVQERDGHMTSRPMEFAIDVRPVITSNPVPLIVTGVEDAAPGENGTLGTMSVLNFETNDPTGSESITQVLIPINKVHSGIDIYAKEGDTWVKVDDNSDYMDGSNYKFTLESQINGGIAIAVDPNGNLRNCNIDDDSVKLQDVAVTVKDVENGGTERVEQIVNDVIIQLEGIADKPTISSFSGSEPVDRVFNLSINVDFPDKEPTVATCNEHQYFTITPMTTDGVPSLGWSFNKGVNNGNGTWTFTRDEILSGGLTIKASGSVDAGSYKLLITAYAVEGNTEETDSMFTTINLTTGPGTEPSIKAQTPTLTLLVPTFDEDTSITLDKLIDCNNTHTNDTDPNGREELSFIIKGLPDGFELESDKPIVKYSEPATGKTVYSFSVGVEPSATQLEAELQTIRLVAPENFSGKMPEFSITAVAVETGGHSYDSASVTKSAEANISPVADGFTVIPADGTFIIDEDIPMPIKVKFISNDGVTSTDDLPESFDNIKISVESSQGSFVDSENNVLGVASGNTTTLDVTVDSNNQIFYGGKLVYFKPIEHASGSFKFTVTADVTDTTIINAVSVSNTSSQSSDVLIEVLPVPDNPTGNDFSVDTLHSVGTVEHGIYNTVEDEAVNLHLKANFADLDGSEFHTLLIRNVPDGSRFIDNNGLTLGMNNGDGSWTFKPSDLTSANGFRYIAPLHQSGDIQLELYAAATEKDNGLTAISSEEFIIRIAPKANGAVITPKNGISGSWNMPVQAQLEAALVEQEDYNSYSIKQPNGEPFVSDELYKVIFKSDDGADFHLYTKNSDGDMILLPDIDGNALTYTVEQLNQNQIDNLYIGMESDLSGTRVFDVKVMSQETDGNGNILDTSIEPVNAEKLSLNFNFDSNTTINGTDNGDAIYGHAGNQTIHGGGGNDYIYGGAGNDTLYGDDGNDHIYGGTGNDSIYGGNGDDYIDGGEGADIIFGGAGSDRIVFDYNDIINGDEQSGVTSGKDTLILQAGDNLDFNILKNSPGSISNIEAIDMNNGTSDSINNLSVKDLLDMTDSNNTLFINGENGDSVQLTNNEGIWDTDNTSTTNIDGIDYTVYTGTFEMDTVTLYVQDNLSLI